MSNQLSSSTIVLTKTGCTLWIQLCFSIKTDVKNVPLLRPHWKFLNSLYVGNTIIKLRPIHYINTPMLVWLTLYKWLLFALFHEYSSRTLIWRYWINYTDRWLIVKYVGLTMLSLQASIILFDDMYTCDTYFVIQ